MKKLLLVLLIIVVVGSLVCCTTQTTTQTSTQTTTTQPVTPVVIKYGTDLPPQMAPMVGQIWWADEVTKRTEGRVTVQMYPASTLVPQATAYEAVITGVADMYMLSTSSHRKSFPLMQIPSIPGAGFPDDTLAANQAHRDTFFALYNKYPAFAAECKDFAPLFFYFIYSESYLISKDKKITVPQDLKGMKVGSNGIRLDLMAQMGAAPVTDVPPTAYEKLQTGVTDAAFAAISAVHDFKLFEVTDYILDVPFGGGGMLVVVNKNTWNKISPQDQQLMKDLAVEGERMIHVELAKANTDAWTEVTGMGKKVITTKEEKALWDKGFSPLWETWIADNEKAGVTDAREIFNFWKSAADKAWGE